MPLSLELTENNSGSLEDDFSALVAASEQLKGSGSDWGSESAVSSIGEEKKVRHRKRGKRGKGKKVDTPVVEEIPEEPAARTRASQFSEKQLIMSDVQAHSATGRCRCLCRWTICTLWRPTSQARRGRCRRLLPGHSGCRSREHPRLKTRRGYGTSSTRQREPVSGRTPPILVSPWAHLSAPSFPVTIRELSSSNGSHSRWRLRPVVAEPE